MTPADNTPLADEEIARALELEQALRPRPIDDWHEDFGAVLWWKLPVSEPPYAGTPLDDDFPGYQTHWTPIVVPVATGEREA